MIHFCGATGHAFQRGRTTVSEGSLHLYWRSGSHRTLPLRFNAQGSISVDVRSDRLSGFLVLEHTVDDFFYGPKAADTFISTGEQTLFGADEICSALF